MSQEHVQQLLAAIRGGDRATLDQLLGADASLVRATAPNGASAVLWAVYTGHPELASVLVGHGAQLDIWDAAALGDLARTRQIVAGDPRSVTSVAPDGFFALGLAAFFGHLEVVTWLLDHGADVNQHAGNAQRVTALHGAVARGNAPLARLLLERGANANVRQETGLAPLHEAAANGRVELVRLLIEHGAQVDIRTDAGKTPAEFARERGHAELADWLQAPALRKQRDGGTMTDDELTRQVAARVTAMWDAYQAQDVVRHDALLADDYVAVSPDGTARAGKPTPRDIAAASTSRYTISGLHAELLAPGVALVTYVASVEGPSGGHIIRARYSVGNVWVLRNGAWVNRYYQGTPLP